MRHKAICTIAAAFLCAFQTAPAQAQTRVFVAAQGSDANPCTFALPCRTFQHAHDVVAAGGEIDVLDPAGYGTLTIIKAISIQGHDFSGMTVPAAGTGIIINAGPDDIVNLRGLIIEGAGTGPRGIRFNTGKALTITDCVMRNLTTGTAVAFYPNASSNLTVSNVLIVDNGANAIEVSPIGSG